MKRDVVLAWSGGKDCTLALERLRADRHVAVAGLITTVTPEQGRIRIHGVRPEILAAQGRSLGLPVYQVPAEQGADNATYDAAWARGLEEVARAIGRRPVVAYGDLFLEDIRTYREAHARRIGYETLFPVWGEDTTQLSQRFVSAGYEAYLTCVDTALLDGAFAGRRYDARLLAELPPSVDPCGELGEFHTCVVAGPLFAERIAVTVGAHHLRDERFEHADLMIKTR